MEACRSHHPRSCRFRQFFIDLTPFQEKALAAFGEEGLGRLKKAWQGRESARRYDVGGEGFEIGEAGVVDDGAGFGGAVDGVEESALAAIAFDQVDRRAAHDGEDEAGKSGAAAKVDHGSRRRRQQTVQLGRVEEVAAPYIGKASGAHQVDAALPLDQHRDKGLEAQQAGRGDAGQAAELLG